MWLLGQLSHIHQQVDLIPETFICCLKQIKGGDDSKENLWWCHSLVNVFEKLTEWIKNHPILIKHIIYTFSRLIIDHHKYDELQTKEKNLVLDLIKSNVWFKLIIVFRRIFSWQRLF
jgi:hypothetical protein